MSKGGVRPGAGRKPGVPNSTTKAVKEAILGAFDRAGGESYLLEVAKSDPRTFCHLLSKVVPAEVKAELHHSKLNVAEILMRKRRAKGIHNDKA